MAESQRKAMLEQFKRVSAHRIGCGEWTHADADEVAASIRVAIESGDPVKAADAAAYLQAEFQVVDQLDEMVRSANVRLKVQAEARRMERGHSHKRVA